MNPAELAQKAKNYKDAKGAFDKNRHQISQHQASIVALERQQNDLKTKLEWAELELRAAACGLPVECFELELKVLADKQK